MTADTTALSGPVLRQAFGCFPSGVTAVCALVDDEPVGVAASSFMSVSLDPPLVSVCVANESSTWIKLRTSPRLGVSILGADHALACRQLAAKEGDRFAGIDWYVTDGGAIRLAGTPLVLDCSLEEELPAGDHLIALLRILAIEVDGSVPPLVFHASTFRQLAPQ